MRIGNLPWSPVRDAMYLEAAKHSVEPALTVTEQDTYLYQSG